MDFIGIQLQKGQTSMNQKNEKSMKVAKKTKNRFLETRVKNNENCKERNQWKLRKKAVKKEKTKKTKEKQKKPFLKKRN